MFTTDASNCSGMSGAPRVHLATRDFLGVSLYGVWHCERKFSFAATIPKEARDLILRRQQDELVMREPK